MASVPRRPPSAAPARILVRGVNWLGDAVMTTPALVRLRARFPAARITLLTAEKLAALWPGHPALDEVWSFAPSEGAWTVARRLRAGRFDLAVLLPNSPRSGLEAFLARIPRRVGGAWPWRNWLLTDVVPPAPGTVRMHKRTGAEIRELTRPGAPAPGSSAGFQAGPEAHQSHHYLRLVGHLGGDPTPVPPQLAVTPAELAAVRERFGLDAGVDWIGLNAGAEYGPAKRWPAENFVAAAKQLGAVAGRGFVLFGGRADESLAAGIAAALADAGHSVRTLAGRTSLRELCAALAACRVVLTNDTGPMHVAAAVGTPVVVPFGSTSFELTGPGLPGDSRHALLRPPAAAAPCAPCFRRECPIDFRCMAAHTPGRVAAAVAARLPGGEGTAPAQVQR